MFTGLVERTGKLTAWRDVRGAVSVTITHEPWDTPLTTGESVAVNGICLTVAEAAEDRFTCDVLDETLRRTSIRPEKIGKLLNLERALRVGDRLGGHMVSGHVDGVGVVERVMPLGRDYALRIRCAPELLQEIVVKGSVACDGISLTVTDVTTSGFEVNVIPHTWRQTAMIRLQAGDPVNIETDLIAKYVRKCLGRQDSQGTLSLDALQRAGF